MKKLLGILVLGLLVAVQSQAAEKETIAKSLLEQYDKEIASLDGKISKLEKTIEIGDVDTTSPLDMGTPVHVEATNDMSEEFTIIGQVNDSKKPSNIKKKDTNNKQSDPLKTEKTKLESEKIKQDIQFEIDITKGREVLTNEAKDYSGKGMEKHFPSKNNKKVVEIIETGDPERPKLSFDIKEKEINQLELFKTQKAKLEAEKIRLTVQLNKYIDRKILEQKIIDTQTKGKKRTKTETRKALKKTLSELKKAKKKKKILKKKKKVRKKKSVAKKKRVKKKNIIKKKRVKKKKILKKKKKIKKKKVSKRKPVKKKKNTRKKEQSKK